MSSSRHARRRLLAGSQQRTVSDTEAREIEHGSQVEGETGAPRMVAGRGVDEKQVGALLERAHGALEERPAAQRQQAGDVRRAGLAAHRGLGEHLVRGAGAHEGRPGPGGLARLTRAGAARRIGRKDGGHAHIGKVGRAPRSSARRRGGQRALLILQLPHRPRPGSANHPLPPLTVIGCSPEAMSPDPGVPVMRDYRTTSLWLDGVPGELTPRPSLPGDIDVDVAIVGAGYTGLWTAYYLAKADPQLRVAVLEREIAGFGASGRNGGWCSAYFAASLEKLAASQHGRDEAIRHAAGDVRHRRRGRRGRAPKRASTPQFHKGGVLDLAITPAQLLPPARGAGVRALMGLRRGRLGVARRGRGARAAQRRRLPRRPLHPHCAAVDPARLARGLAETVERLGVTIYEQTPVSSIEGGIAATPLGRVKAEVVVRATEAFTAQLPGYERTLVPIYSLMIGTEPLPEERLGRDRLGGPRGASATGATSSSTPCAPTTAASPWAAAARPTTTTHASRTPTSACPDVIASHERTLRLLFPAIGAARITHTWGGPLGWPRDCSPAWATSASATSPGRAATSATAWPPRTSPAARSRDLITGRESDLTTLPWVGHKSPNWEPEPLRWLGINAAFKLMAHADRVENGIGRPARRAALVDKLLG